MMLRVFVEGQSFVLSEAGQPLEFDSETTAREVCRVLLARETPPNLRSVIKELIQVYDEYPVVEAIEILTVESRRYE